MAGAVDVRGIQRHAHTPVDRRGRVGGSDRLFLDGSAVGFSRTDELIVARTTGSEYDRELDDLKNWTPRGVIRWGNCIRVT